MQSQLFSPSRRRAAHEGGRRRRSIGSLLALVMVLPAMIAIAGPAAAAPEGSINNPAIETVFDGAVVPNSLDDGANNDTVAVNDKVGFRWVITADDLSEGVLSQTIPACWTWDQGTLDSLNTDNTLYTASYAITTNPDGSSTLTGTVTLKDPGTSGITFETLTATVGSSCADGSTYTPVLTVTDGAGPAETSADPITVQSETRSDLIKVATRNGTAGTHDFGAGAVAAFYSDFTVTIQRPAPGVASIGAGDTTLALPLSFTDTITPSVAGATTDTEVIPVSLPVGTTATLAGTTVTIDGPTDLNLATGDYRVVVRVWVPATEVPVTGAPALTMRNVVAPVGDWGVVNNDVVPTNNTATTTYQQPPPDTGAGIQRGKDLWAASNQANPTYGVDPARPGTGYVNVSGRTVAPNAVVMSRFYFQAARLPGGTSNGSTNLIAYDFWDPSEQQLISDQGYFLGDANGNALPASAYTVEYTNGSSTTNPGTTNTWFASVAAAGGPTAVSGIRFIYTDGVYGAGAPTWYLAGVPFRIVGDVGEVVEDTAVWTSDQASSAFSNNVSIAPYTLGVAKTADRASYVSGDVVRYTISPTLAPAPGGVSPVTANPFQIVDVMPASVISIDTTGLDPAWTVTTTPGAGGGLVATFTFVGTASSAAALPPITYTAQTSIVAPAGNTLTNTAQVRANNVDGPTATRTVTVRQANVTTKQKVSTIGPDIEVGDPVVSWTSTWVNYQNVSQGPSTFVDVLPYNGDDRGTSFTGTATLRSATLGGAAAANGTLFYTTDPAATVADAPAASTTWIDATGVDLTTIPGITALKVEIADFASGDAGVGSLAVALDVEGQQIGDIYANTITGKTNDFTFGDGRPAVVEVVGSSLSGLVWEDIDGDGTVNGAEAGIAGVTVTLVDSENAEVGTAVTAADGTYTFDQLPSGTYSVVVSQSTVNTAFGSGSIQTHDLTPPLDNDSGDVAVAREEDREGVNFGYQRTTAGLTLVKKTNGEVYDAAPGALVAVGADITWTYEVTNTGNTTLTDIEVTDSGSDDVAPVVTCPESIAPGATVECTASGTAIAGQYENTAVATASDPSNPGGDDVTSNEASSWYFGVTAGLELVKLVNGTDQTSAPGLRVRAGSTVTWTYEVTNTGNYPVTEISVVDEGTRGVVEVTCPALPDGGLLRCRVSR